MLAWAPLAHVAERDAGREEEWEAQPYCTCRGWCLQPGCCMVPSSEDRLIFFCLSPQQTGCHLGIIPHGWIWAGVAVFTKPCHVEAPKITWQGKVKSSTRGRLLGGAKKTRRKERKSFGKGQTSCFDIFCSENNWICFSLTSNKC